MAVQTVRLTFGMWDYRAVMEVKIGGNCTGLTVIDSAVENAYETLEQRGNYGSDDTYAVLYLAKPSAPDQVLECGDDEGHGDEWLKDMLVAAEIVSIQPKEESSHG
ncbi:hypothetical protein D9M69_701290 [compost metagenome]